MSYDIRIYTEKFVKIYNDDFIKKIKLDHKNYIINISDCKIISKKEIPVIPLDTKLIKYIIEINIEPSSSPLKAFKDTDKIIIHILKRYKGFFEDPQMNKIFIGWYNNKEMFLNY